MCYSGAARASAVDLSQYGREKTERPRLRIIVLRACADGRSSLVAEPNIRVWDGVCDALLGSKILDQLLRDWAVRDSS